MPPARSVALQAGEIFERMAVLELCADPKINVDVAGRCSSRGQQRPCDGEPSVHMASDVRGEAKAGSQKSLAAAVAGNWDQSHRIVQEFGDPFACWIHAVLHKIEGDAQNSRYWYARTQVKYEDFPDPKAELAAIGQQLEPRA